MPNDYAINNTPFQELPITKAIMLIEQGDKIYAMDFIDTKGVSLTTGYDATNGIFSPPLSDLKMKYSTCTITLFEKNQINIPDINLVSSAELEEFLAHFIGGGINA